MSLQEVFKKEELENKKNSLKTILDVSSNKEVFNSFVADITQSFNQGQAHPLHKAFFTALDGSAKIKEDLRLVVLDVAKKLISEVGK